MKTTPQKSHTNQYHPGIHIHACYEYEYVSSHHHSSHS